MNTSTLVLLGIAALGSLTQAVALVVLGLELRRSVMRLDVVGRRVGQELRPALAHLTIATDHLKLATESSVVEARRLDGLLEDVSETVGNTGLLLERVVVPYLRRLVTVTAVVKTVRKGMAFYQRWKDR